MERFYGLSRYLKVVDESSNKKSLAPVEQWQPEHHSEMDLTIKSNGEWWHEGIKMTRQSLVDLFATVLWMEQPPYLEDCNNISSHQNYVTSHNEVTDSNADSVKSYYLKTPVEQVKIKVEDVPFFINDVSIVLDSHSLDTDCSDDKIYWLEFTTTTGDTIRLDEAHFLFFNEYNEQMRPYIHVRFGMDALIMRNVFYHLIEIGMLSEHDGEIKLTLISGNQPYYLKMLDC